MNKPTSSSLVPWILALAGCATSAPPASTGAGAQAAAQSPAAGTAANQASPSAAGAKAAAGMAAPAAVSGGAAGAKPAGAAGTTATAQAGSTGAAPGTAGSAAGGRGGTPASGGAGAPAAAGGGGSGSTAGLEHFSFFMTSLKGLQRLSKNDKGFGGDLRYGQPNGLAGADKICTDLAEASMPGAGAKGWHAFLSAAKGPSGGAVNAIDRIGDGPWYDRNGRILAMNKSALLNARPQGADPAIINDLPNEDGIPNKQPDPNQPEVNNHHALTGSDTSGKLYNGSASSTCSDWTSTASDAGRPRVGFSYPAGNRQHWISGQDEGGCGAGAVLVDMGGSDPSNPIVGSGGGYGGFYCFALMP